MMQLEDFWVASGTGTVEPGSAIHVITCQRELWIGIGEVPSGLSPCATLRLGETAYLFLLRVSTGLESRVQGETDVFGQLKQAWQSAPLGTEARSQLDPWMQRLFEDTKEIRTRHLQNLGGASYGSLVRKLLRENSGDLREPVLLVGAGQLARSIAPFLGEQLVVYARDAKKLAVFASEIGARGVDHLESAWKSASHIVIAVPAGGEAESHWIEWSKARSHGKIMHLGGQRSNFARAWFDVSGFYALDDLFDLQSTQDQARVAQLARAARACEERVKLRSLGASISIPHGWEDLAVFA